MFYNKKFKRSLTAAIFCMMLSASIVFSGCSSSGNSSNSKTITVPESSSVSEIKAESSVTLDTSDTETTYNESEAVKITLSGNTAEISGKGATIDGGIVTVSEAGTYVFSGKLDDGQIIVNAGKDDDVKIVLNNAGIKSTKASAISAVQCGKLFLLLEKGSSNTISGGNTVDETDSSPDAAIYVKDDMTILGEGELTVNGNAKNGITSKNTLKITGGKITVSAENHGITGKDDLYIQNSSISVETKSGDGLRSNNSDTDKGNVYIENSDITVVSANDGIQAENNLTVSSGTISITTGGGAAKNTKSSQGDFFVRTQTQSEEDTESMKGLKAGGNLIVTAGTITIDSYDDSLHSDSDVKIGGGTITMKSGDDGVHADNTLTIADGNITVSQSYEGLEANNINISGGKIDVTAADDGVNCSGGNDSSGFGGMDQNMHFGGRGNRMMNNNNSSDNTNNKQMPQIQDGDIPSTPDGQIPQIPSGDMPSMPDGQMPQMPGGDMPSMPDGQIPQIPSGDMPSMPDGQMPQTPDNQNNNDNKENTSNDKGSINISGGTVYVSAQGDGLDSNGELNITGGNIIVNGTTQGGNGIIDHDGNCTISGGTLAGAGTSDMLELPSSSSPQCTVAVLLEQSAKAGELIYITDNSGNILVAMTPEKNYSCLIFSSPELRSGEIYKVYTGGTITGDSIHGYYSNSSVSGGTLYSTFTISDSISYVNSTGITNYSGMGGNMRGNFGVNAGNRGMKNNFNLNGQEVPHL